MGEGYIPRFSFEISEEQKGRADRLLGSYGYRKAIFPVILDDLLDLIEEFGGAVIGALISESIKAREVLPSLKKAEEVGKRDGNT